MNYCANPGQPGCRKDTAIIAPVRENRFRAHNKLDHLARTLLLLGALTGVSEVCLAQPAKVPPLVAEQGHLPDFRVIETAIRSHFASQKDFAANDLVTQSQIEQALDAVFVAGWDVPDRAKITERAISDGSFLAKELSSPAGRKFMRRISEHPGGYNRLDRLSSIAGGQQLVRDLIQKKDGDKLIAYLATTTGGQNLGRMATNTGQGVNLNKPTGRIYIAADLLAALKASYDRSR